MNFKGRLRSPGDGHNPARSLFISSSKKDTAEKISSSKICTLEGAVIRQFLPKDQEEAFTLHQKAMASVQFKSRDFIGTQEYADVFEHGMKDIHKFFFKDRSRQDFFVLEYLDKTQWKIAGIGGLESEKGDAKTVVLVDLRADPDLNGHHIGESIAAAQVKRAWELGYSRLFAYTVNGAVHHILQDLGFEPKAFSKKEQLAADSATWIPEGDYACKYRLKL